MSGAKPFAVEQCASPEEVARSAARATLELLRQQPHSTIFTLALSGGRIARQYCEHLAQAAQASPVRLANVHFFWGDERCVPPSDPESNFQIAEKLLLKPMQIPAAQIHRIQGESRPELAAKEATAELRRIAPPNHEGLPVLDLVLLGMGEDGHVASLFPGEGADVMRSPEVYRPVTASKPPPLRITLGYSTIAAARHVWVLASGKGKKAALAGSVRAGGQTPLARVISQRATTRIFTDLTPA